MIYRGEYTCPDCKKTYKWISESKHRLSEPGLPSVLDYGAPNVVHVSINNYGNKTYVSGNCPCGMPFNVPADIKIN